MDDEDRRRFQIAREQVERDKREQDAIDDMYQEYLIQSERESRFRKFGREDVLHMWEYACNEFGDDLDQFEFEALCERWAVVFPGNPPREAGFSRVVGEAPLPVPSKRRKLAAQEREPRPVDIANVDDDTMLSTKQVLNITGMSLSTFERKRSKGEISEPYRISEWRIGWTMRDIRDFVSGMWKARRGRH